MQFKFSRSIDFQGNLADPGWTAVSDFDRDGRPEVVLTRFTFPGYDWLNVPILEFQDDGSLVDIAATLFGREPLVRFGRDVIVDDFNNDGWQDLFVADHGLDIDPFPGSENPFWLSDGMGGWQDVTSYDAQDFTHSAAAGDVDQDGLVEIIVGHLGVDSAQFLEILPDGTGTRPDARLNAVLAGFGGVPAVSRFEVADLDGDGEQEILLGADNNVDSEQSSLIARWNGTTFETTDLPDSFGERAITVDIDAVDVNGDGRLDIVMMQTRVDPFYTGASMKVLIQNAQGSFDDQSSQWIRSEDLGDSTTDSWSSQAHFADLDLDGDLDVVLQMNFPSGHKIFYQEKGRFVLQDQVPGFGFDNSALALVDEDGDGAVEIIDLQNFDVAVFDRGIGLLDDLIEGDGRDDVIYALTGDDTVIGGAGDDLLSGETSDAYGDAVAEQVYRLYATSLGRPPEAGGLETWIERLESGMSLEEAAGRFVISAEFKARFDADNTGDFVTLLYNNVLGRDPDPGGFATWTNRIDVEGWSRGRVVAQLSESAEHVARTMAAAMSVSSAGIEAGWADDIYRLYAATLNRAPDVQGFHTWVDRMVDGRPYLDAIAGFMNSNEFKTRFVADTTEEFVNLLYQNILGRAPDAGGFATWINRLDVEGMSRAEAVSRLSQSAEFISNTNEAMRNWMPLAGEADRLDGGEGDNILFGGLGADTFVISQANGGTQTIADLEIWDSVEMTGFGYSAASEVRGFTTQVGDDLVFADQGVTVIFKNLDLDDLGDDQFLF